MPWVVVVAVYGPLSGTGLVGRDDGLTLASLVRLDACLLFWVDGEVCVCAKSGAASVSPQRDAYNKGGTGGGYFAREKTRQRRGGILTDSAVCSLRMAPVVRSQLPESCDGLLAWCFEQDGWLGGEPEGGLGCGGRWRRRVERGGVRWCWWRRHVAHRPVGEMFLFGRSSRW